MIARVQKDGEYSEPFPVTNGVKQGCLLAPTLFSTMFSATLTSAFQSCDDGFPIRYRFDSKMCNLKSLQAKSKMQTGVHLTKKALTERKMQEASDRISQACDHCDHKISTKRTEVVSQPAPGKPHSESTITVNGQRLQAVDKFTYVGSTLSRAVHIDDEVIVRSAKAGVAFGRLFRYVEMSGIEAESGLTQS